MRCLISMAAPPPPGAAVTIAPLNRQETEVQRGKATLWYLFRVIQPVSGDSCQGPQAAESTGVTAVLDCHVRVMEVA